MLNMNNITIYDVKYLSNEQLELFTKELETNLPKIGMSSLRFDSRLNDKDIGKVVLRPDPKPADHRQFDIKIDARFYSTLDGIVIVGFDTTSSTHDSEISSKTDAEVYHQLIKHGFLILETHVCQTIKYYDGDMTHE